MADEEEAVEPWSFCDSVILSFSNSFKGLSRLLRLEIVLLSGHLLRPRRE